MVELITAHDNTYAGQIRMKARKNHLLVLLWAFGLYGKLQNGKHTRLVIDSTIQGRRPQVDFFVRKRDNRLHYVFSQSFAIMKKFGVTGKFIPMKDSEWILQLSFNKKAGGRKSLVALKQFTSALVKKYGEPKYAGKSKLKGEAFALFSIADMRIIFH